MTTKKESKIIESVILADNIMDDFTGLASDLAYYELLEMCEDYLKGDLDKNDFVEQLDFTFGFNGEKQFDKIFNRSQKEYKETTDILYGKV
jgi:hypothetical protein